MLQEVPTREVLAMFGAVGAALSGAVAAVAERRKLDEVAWSAATVEAMLGARLPAPFTLRSAGFDLL